MPRERKEPVVDFGFRPPSPGSHSQTPQPLGETPAAPAIETIPAPPVSEAFRAKAERWKRDLLDVTRRNRAINYRPSKATLTLPASPDDLWDVLVVNEAGTSFNARNFAPDAPDPNADIRATDAFASTRRLADRARLADREQGIQVLFTALGWLHWVDSEGHQLQSPLLLVPVELIQNRQEKEIELRAAADDPPEVNPSLAYLLQAQLGISLPKLEDEDGERLHATLDSFLAAVKDVISKQAGWGVEKDGSVVDVFSFAKLAMVDEIDRSLSRLAQHPILKALAGEGQLPVLEAPSESIDSRFRPGSLRTVVEADAYQLEAVALAASGSSFVIEGPPGTGKSQTITNIAAELMAQGKRVLFLAEKRVAREVVLDNLASAGLAEACLHLASNAGAASRADAKARVIKEIVDTLDAGPPPPQPEAALPGRYAELRDRLNAYASGIGSPIGEGGWTTVFEVIGKAIELAPDCRDNLPVPSIAGKSRFWLDDVTDAAKSLDAFKLAELTLLATPWVNLRWTSNEVGKQQQLASALETLGGFAQSLETIAAPVLGTHAPASALPVASVKDLCQRLQQVATFRKKSGSFLHFVNPGYYSARGHFKSFAAAGYTPNGAEGDTEQRLSELTASVEAALAVATDAFGEHAPISASSAEIASWAQALLPGLPQFPVLTEMAAILAILQHLEMRDAFVALLADTTTQTQLAKVVPATVYGGWAAQLVQGDLATSPDQRTRLIDSYARLDAEMVGWSRTTVLGSVRSKRPRSINHGSMAPLVKYARAKRRPALRTMLGKSREAVQLLKPTLLMSPLAAAQYLCHGDDEMYRFDTVIVDEASMIPTPDMVVAISLANQAIIVGDSKQMPPTNFFQKEIAPTSDGPDDEDITFESVLDEAAPLLSSTMLRAHYRSRDESLIAFSNVHFYDGKLVAYPDAWGTRPESGVRFELVKDAIYGRGASRANPAEAKRTVELLRSELEASGGKREVAITSMSLAQQGEILGQLEAAAVLDPLIRSWVEGGGLVRNLETVQGDESDVMILSVGYGKDEGGRMILNFGPLGQEKGERRLNVAITRAKWKTILVTSIHSGDIDPARTTSTGTLSLRDYLDYAERGPDSLPAVGTNVALPITPFERVVIAAATANGLQCVPRVGVGGYRVDIAVRHPDIAERFVLAIECDGPNFSGAPACRDREIGRAGVLARMGWTVHRAFSTAWFKDPETELSRLLEAYRTATLK